MPRIPNDTTAMERHTYWLLAAAFAAAYIFAGAILPWYAGPKADGMRHLLFGIAQIRLDGAHLFVMMPPVFGAVLILSVRERNGGSSSPTCGSGRKTSSSCGATVRSSRA